MYILDNKKLLLRKTEMSKSKKNVKKESKKLLPTKTEKTPKMTIDRLTMNLLHSEGITIEQIVKAVSKEYPAHNLDTLKATTKRRLNGYLKNKFNVKIVKDDKGLYRIAS